MENIFIKQECKMENQRQLRKENVIYCITGIIIFTISVILKGFNLINITFLSVFLLAFLLNEITWYFLNKKFKVESCMLFLDKELVDINVGTYSTVKFNIEKVLNIWRKRKFKTITMIHTHPPGNSKMSYIDYNMLYGWAKCFPVPINFLIICENEVIGYSAQNEDIIYEFSTHKKYFKGFVIDFIKILSLFPKLFFIVKIVIKINKNINILKP